jgi:NAD(P)-dependent dehydrogenase (short-subunit alcohol dehydrogenase family)
MIPQGGGSIVLVASMSANVRFNAFLVKFLLTPLQIVNIPQPQTPYNASKAGT